MVAMRRLVVILILISIVLCLLESVAISYVMEVPLWYLIRVGPPAMIFPPYGEMIVEVTPTIPLIVGQSIVVRVVDKYNRTAVEGAKVKVQKDSLEFERLTDENGTTSFPYLGATTVIMVSKEGYLDPEPEVIPKIPDSWILAGSINALGWVITGGIDLAIGYYFYRKGKNSERATTAVRKG